MYVIRKHLLRDHIHKQKSKKNPKTLEDSIHEKRQFMVML